ncbi:uncharacterized protein LOC144145909 isoform X2 [Haemaphysalis longicornis]
MGRPRNTPEQAAATRERRRLREKERRSRMCENGVTVGAMASCERRRDPEVRAREAARRRERYREKMELARAVEKFALRATERSSRVKSASAAQCASSKTWPSLSAGKCDSQAQCVVPLMFKSSQTKTVLISAEVQTRATRKKPAADNPVVGSAHIQAHRKQHAGAPELIRPSNCDQLAFRMELSQDQEKRPHVRTPPQTKKVLHKPLRLEKRKRCKKCYDEKKVDLKTNVICKTCNVCLCFTTARNCFAQWHANLVDLEERPHVHTPPRTKSVLHKPFRLEKRKRCKKCYDEKKVSLKTNVICKTCNVCLCFTTARNCFAQWHTNLGK